ncbi:MAG TPA: hypothetical protein PK636_04805 [bacterium]|nr:hypothetical protein [bacterium]HPJ71981.1 hypothetical protein [bacterium]HPQ66062.1 hypothetical protein [bacterium]
MIPGFLSAKVRVAGGCFSLALCLLGALAGSARPCLLHDPNADKEAAALRDFVGKEGRAAIPRLREVLQAGRHDHPHEQQAERHDHGHEQQLVAIRALAEMGDTDSIPAFKAIVLELVDPAAPGPFGPWIPEAELRAAAAHALSSLEVGGLNERLGREWKSLPLDRRRELPRVIGELREGSVSLLEAMVREGSDRETVFQAVVQLRHLGCREQIGVLDERLSIWEEEYGRLRQGGGSDLYFERQIDYLRKTVQGLSGRR